MTVQQALAEIMDALRRSHEEHEAFRATVEKQFAAIDERFAAVDKRFDEMDKRLTAIENRLDKLGLEFEAFRHDTKIILDMLSELVARTSRHEAFLAALDRRVTRVENHLHLKPLPTGDQ